MTPKEKATELVDKSNLICIHLEDAKQCAIIAVKEVLDTIDLFPPSMFKVGLPTYWNEVKTEIELL